MQQGPSGLSQLVDAFVQAIMKTQVSKHVTCSLADRLLTLCTTELLNILILLAKILAFHACALSMPPLLQLSAVLLILIDRLDVVTT